MEIASLTEVDCPKFKGQKSPLIKSHGKHKRITTTMELKKTTRNIESCQLFLLAIAEAMLSALVPPDPANSVVFKIDTKLTRIIIEYLKALTRRHSNLIK